MSLKPTYVSKQHNPQSINEFKTNYVTKQDNP